MKRRVFAMLLMASVAAAEAPVSNPPPTPESFEFPNDAPAPQATRGVHRAVFFACAGGAVAGLVLGIVMGVVSSNAGARLDPSAEGYSFVSTGGFIGAGLLLVASVLLFPVTRWHD